jgi:hypothetical protein
VDATIAISPAERCASAGHPAGAGYSGDEEENDNKEPASWRMARPCTANQEDGYKVQQVLSSEWDRQEDSGTQRLAFLDPRTPHYP